MAFRVLLVGGGSGGHVYPLVAVARALKKQAEARGERITIRIMGDGPFIKRAAQEARVESSTIVAPKLRRYASAGTVLDIFKVPFALMQSLAKLFFFMPDVVFAKGGYTCAFPTLAARLYRIPVFLHESDSVSGLANRILARRSKLIFTSFPAADQYFQQLGHPTMLVGNPFRQELCCVDRGAAHMAFKLDAKRRTVLVLGGSQGAQQINQLIINTLVQMMQKGWNVIHQTGDRNFAEVKQAVERMKAEGAETYARTLSSQYRMYPFLDESQLAAAYGACDVALTRASAGALTELAYLGKPMAVVPLPGSANDHQQHNAAELARYGAVVIDGVNATPSIVLQSLEHLLDPAIAADVSQRVRAFAKPEAADTIAETLIKVGR